MNIILQKSIRQILIASSASILTAGLIGSANAAKLGVQVPPPNPGQVPDYFGVTPNYATSPQPVLAKVSPLTVSGSGAVIAATTYDYANPNYALNPHGLYTGKVMDVQVVNGGSGYANGDTFQVTGGPGSNPVKLTAIVTNTNGVITDFAEIPSPRNKVNNFVGLGSGFTQPINGTGIRKFVDSLPGLSGVSSYAAALSPSVTIPAPAAPKLLVTVAADSTISAISIDPATVGSGYTPSTTFQVSIDAPPAGGTQATATVSVGQNGSIDPTSIQIINNGSGYPTTSGGVNASVTLPNGSLTPATAVAVVDPKTGGISSISVNQGSNYTPTNSPFPVQVAAPLSFNGQTATATATIDNTGVISISVVQQGSGYNAGKGYQANGANDLGQALPIATPDTTTFPGSDYYVIGEIEYSQQLHSDLPATQLRGYIQLNNDGSKIPGSKPQYLGPIIVAQKDRPVRVKVINMLSYTGDGTELQGALPFPVDHTYMGADDTDNRTSVHQHGGNTPWISDGTPRQTFKPAGETVGSNKGVSSAAVPDMWFDKNGKLFTINGVAVTTPTQDQITANSLTNDPGYGASTFFFTNQQSARFMFYHDHAEGITRLNVYAGLAGGFVLQDPTELAMATPNGGTVDNHSYSQVLPELQDTIPLIIQEKTFVPDNKIPVLNYYGPFKSQLNSQDPTWHWGWSWQYDKQQASPPLGFNGTGDLWVPHVYMTNQNPGDVTGANAIGRWDYGPWFWPVFNTLDKNKILNPYYNPACNNKNLDTATGTCEGMYIPGIPNGNMLSASDISAIQNQWTGLTTGKLPTANDITALGNALSDPKLQQPSGTPEAFNDTPLVNGTVYPYLNVSPKKYRLRILSVGNDRTLNLSLFVASSKNSDTTSDGNIGPTSNAAKSALCDGNNNFDPADCTEVRMVPWNASQNTYSQFPSTWYTSQKGGITFDGRPGGVPDPLVRGPAMVQVGTEGGFLSSPAVIANQPINYEYNLKNIQVTNVKEHALLLGPAERADVVVDFSQFAGSTILLYNDAPAAIPAFDLRLDYFTGNFDNTDTGGAFSTVPGYGPNSRTIMQFRVAADCSYDPAGNCGSGTGINRAPAVSDGAHQDDVDGTLDPVTGNWAGYMGKLTNAVQTAFKFSQEPIIVPQEAYNPVYNSSVVDALGGNVSQISDTVLTFYPFLDPLSGVLNQTPVSLAMGPKTIQELFTTDYGRMNATLGTEIPNTTGINQTTIPLGYLDPPTELVELAKDTGHYVVPSGQMADGTQLWKITHNGVDTHALHFHLFNLQIVNRVGWDGAVYPPEPNELGWKETVRMNPLADVIVALRPKTMSLPFKVPNSHHLLDPSKPVNDPGPGTGMTTGVTNLDPVSGNASNVTNQYVNYGWEYVWHCHILGHEENDMMRAIAVATPPNKPKPAATPIPASQFNNDGSITLNWTDDSVVANWFTITRTDNATPPVSQNFYMYSGECASQTGCTVTYKDTTAKAGVTYAYSVTANNTVGAGDARLDGLLDPVTALPTTTLPTDVAASLVPGFTGYQNVTASSEPLAVASGVMTAPVATVSWGVNNPNPLDFGNLLVGTVSTPAQTVTLSNTTGTAPLLISNIATSGQFAQTNNCGSSVAVGQSCTISVTFKPTSIGNQSGTLTITDNSFVNGVANSTQTVQLSGVSTAPVASLDFSTLDFKTQVIGKTTVAQTVTLANNGTAPLTITSITPPANGFAIAGGSCSSATLATPYTVPVNGSCTINVTFTPAAPAGLKSGSLIINDNSYTTATAAGVANPTQTVTLTGSGVYAPIANLTPAVVTFADTVVGNSATQTITLSNTGTGTQAQGGSLTYTIGALPAGFARTGGTCTYPAQGTLAVNGTCTIIARFSPTVGQAYSGSLTITDNSFGSASQTVTLNGNGFEAPAVPSISGLSNNGLVLSWLAPNGASAPVSYTVQRASNAAFTNGVNIVASGLTALTANVTGLTANTTYYFRVVAVYSTISANGAVSSPVLTLPAVPVAPPQPTGTNVTATSMTLTAPAAATGVTYNLSVNGVVVNASPVTGGTLVTATGLSGGTSYSVNWTAINASGSSIGTASNVVTLPAVPDATSIGAINVAATGLTLNWTAVNGAASYTVQRATVTNGVLGAFGNLITVNGNTAAITGLTANTTYVFHVSATNAAGTTLYSGNSASQTTLPATPAAPTQASATSTANSLGLTAPAAATGVTYNLSVNGTVVNASPVTGGTVVTATGLSGGTSYSVNWSAINAGGTSNGATANLVTRPDAPSQPSVSPVSASSVTVNWFAVTGATGYTLQYSTNAGATWTNVGTGNNGVRTTAASLGSSSKSATILGLTGNTSYTFQLLASDAAGAGAYSPASAGQLTAPSTPTGVSAANGLTGAPITGGLNWTAPVGGATSYTVTWTGPASGSATATSGQQLTFATAGTYSMTVTANNATSSTTSAAVNVTVR